MTFGALLAVVLLWAGVYLVQFLLGVFVFVVNAVLEKLKRT